MFGEKVMDDPIVKMDLIGVKPDGSRITITIQVGKPYLSNRAEGFEEWACPVSLTPLYKKLADARGVDSFQALCMASSLVIDLLSRFREKGGKLLIDEENEFPLDEYYFGKR